MFKSMGFLNYGLS